VPGYGAAAAGPGDPDVADFAAGVPRRRPRLRVLRRAGTAGRTRTAAGRGPRRWRPASAPVARGVPPCSHGPGGGRPEGLPARPV